MKWCTLFALLLPLVFWSRVAWGEDRAKARAALEAGAEAYKEGNYQEALRQYQLAIEAAPSAAGPYRELGKAYDALGDLKNAKLAYEEYLKKSPTAKDAELIRARVEEIALATEDWERAKEEMKAGAEAYAAGDFREARRRYQLAIKAAPSAAGPYRELGKAYDALGELLPAKEAYEEYLERNPTAKDAELIRARLKEISSLFVVRGPSVLDPLEEEPLRRRPAPPSARGPLVVGALFVSAVVVGGVVAAIAVSNNVEDNLLLP